MSLKGTECSCRSSTNNIMKKKHVLNYGPHSEIDICSCNDCSFTRYVCNDCKCSHINLREFKCIQCLVKNLEECIDHECDYFQSHSFYLEYCHPDDEYDCLQNHDLHLENDASPDNNYVHGATLSIIKTDDNYSAMAKAAEDQTENH
jgi:hypothetical protein